MGQVTINISHFYQISLTEVTVKSLKKRTGLVENIGLKVQSWAGLAHMESTSRELQPGGRGTQRTFSLHAAPHGWPQLHQGSKNQEI